MTDSDAGQGHPGVVVGVDGTWNALGAVAWAAAEARLRGVPSVSSTRASG